MVLWWAASTMDSKDTLPLNEEVKAEPFDDRSDWMSLPTLHRRLFFLSCLSSLSVSSPHPPLLSLSKASCHVERNPLERPTWQGVKELMSLDNLRLSIHMNELVSESSKVYQSNELASGSFPSQEMTTSSCLPFERP